MNSETDNGEEDRLLKPSDVARLANVSLTAVYRWRDAGKLPYVCLPGGKYRFRESRVRELLAEKVGELPRAKHRAGAISRAERDERTRQILADVKQPT